MPTHFSNKMPSVIYIFILLLLAKVGYSCVSIIMVCLFSFCPLNTKIQFHTIASFRIEIGIGIEIEIECILTHLRI